jgi:transcriptional regulator with XRE-family HTH domain
MNTTEVKKESAERLKQVLHRLRITTRDFAKKVGVSQSTISQIIGPSTLGGRAMSVDLMIKITRAYPEFSYKWLERGTGEMLLPNKALEQNQHNLLASNAMSKDWMLLSMQEQNTAVLNELLDEARRTNGFLERIANAMERQYPA